VDVNWPPKGKLSPTLQIRKRKREKARGAGKKKGGKVNASCEGPYSIRLILLKQ